MPNFKILTNVIRRRNCNKDLPLDSNLHIQQPFFLITLSNQRDFLPKRILEKTILQMQPKSHNNQCPLINPTPTLPPLLQFFLLS